MDDDGRHCATGPMTAVARVGDVRGEAPAAPASPQAHRAGPPRWRDARLMLGVLLVLASVVAGSRVVAGAQHVQQVWLVRRDVASGTTLLATDLRLVDVRLDTVGPSYVGALDIDPVGAVLTRPVTAGELLPLAALQSAESVNARLVTIPVERFHYPAGLDRGQRVDVYVTPKADASRPVVAPSRVLATVLVAGMDKDGSRFGATGTVVGVVLSVAPDDVAAVVAAARTGSIDLVAGSG